MLRSLSKNISLAATLDNLISFTLLLAVSVNRNKLRDNYCNNSHHYSSHHRHSRHSHRQHSPPMYEYDCTSQQQYQSNHNCIHSSQYIHPSHDHDMYRTPNLVNRFIVNRFLLNNFTVNQSLKGQTYAT